MPGRPAIPVEVYQHCAVPLNNGGVMVVGGIQDGTLSNKTYIFSADLEFWYEGPELNVPRSGASCGVVNSEEIIVAGGYNNDGHLSSTEVIND